MGKRAYMYRYPLVLCGGGGGGAGGCVCVCVGVGVQLYFIRSMAYIEQAYIGHFMCYIWNFHALILIPFLDQDMILALKYKQKLCEFHSSTLLPN